MSTNETIVGTIENMEKMASENPKAPSGSFFVDKKKLTVWDEEVWNSLEEGKSYSFLVSAKKNEYNGKTYTNYNVISGMPEEPLEKSDLKIDQFDVLIDDSVDEIHLPSTAIEWLKERI